MPVDFGKLPEKTLAGILIGPLLEAAQWIERIGDRADRSRLCSDTRTDEPRDSLINVIKSMKIIADRRTKLV